MTLRERFLRYVTINTQSCEASDSFPSTESQLVFMGLLREEMMAIGLSDVVTDKSGYTMGTIPATEGCESAPTIGFIAHVDTSPDMCGEGVKPQIIECYDGGDIILNADTIMRVCEFPELKGFVGHTVVHTDGTTLLGSDDKAGVAAIMTAAQWLISNRGSVKHGAIRVGFTPDEEIGRGVDFFDVEAFGAKYAYTIDGGVEGELEYENFNAAGAKIEIKGRNVHPGYAKDKMINAINVACELHGMLPSEERPEHTSGYEGFFHCVGIKGEVESSQISYIIRDHDRAKFEQRKALMVEVVEQLQQKYGEGVLTLTLNDQYYNMREMVEPHVVVIDKACEAMEMAGVTPIIRPIRGGTDGARLSFMGLPCPNLFTGGINFHGRYECCSLTSMQRSVETIINIAKLMVKEIV